MAREPDRPGGADTTVSGIPYSAAAILRRARVALAGAMLAFSAALSGPALAQEPDREQEGTAEPEEPRGDDADDPGFDPGGDTVLPLDVGPPPTTPPGGADEDDGPPLDAEPLDDPDARLDSPTEPETRAPHTEEDDPFPPAERRPAPASPRAPRPLPSQPPGDTETPDAPDSRSPAERPEGNAKGTRPDRTLKTRLDGRVPLGRPPQPPPQDLGGRLGQPPAAPAPPASPAPGAAAAEPVDVARASAPRQQPRSQGPRFHVVVAGESLWAIAADLLGRGASPASIACEVDRLWSLNEERIGTGDPDLLMVGTKLRLR